MIDTTPRPTSRSPLAAGDLAHTVVFAAFIAVLGIFPGIHMGGSGVPIVLQNAGPLLAGCVLGARRGAASVLLFLVLTAIGLPLLSGGRAGIAPFLGPGGGFLVGWLASAAVAGLVATRLRGPRLPVLLVAAVAGLLTDYAIGIPWLGVYTGLPAAAVQSLVFVPGDAVKVVAAATIAAAAHRALPGRLVATGNGRRTE
ncbi:biotin transporter BioY [Saccharomonospora cyanea]|uniref:Biotin transporter n=1 Tax=Saccharomonospora cyanea NA-134 TaxID=882082 RepID=H5XI96_9PSEU|nr:biotin transporter BioY [Saccharomonospora cyanea]EHR61724.1 hypothetical protein SaccyDRAFT_2878 [Saccharomonospora cyanea NA-134]